MSNKNREAKTAGGTVKTFIAFTRGGLNPKKQLFPRGFVFSGLLNYSLGGKACFTLFLRER